MKLTPTTTALVSGASGSLGWALAEVLAPSCKLYGTYHLHRSVPPGVEGVRLDLGKAASIREVLNRTAPDVVIHLAALTDPDKCEENRRLAIRINYEATSEIARISREMRCKVVFTSTDLVFDGSRGDYGEEDDPNPLSVYGMSKLRAEQAVLDHCEHGVVLRSSLIYGTGSPTSKTFLTSVAERLSRGQPVKLFTDQRRNPILAEDLARAIVSVLECDLSGLYHVGGPERLTRFQFGQKVCAAMGYDEALLVPIRMGDFPYRAKRPLDSTLRIGKFRAITGFAPHGISEGLDRLRRDISFD